MLLTNVLIQFQKKNITAGKICSYLLNSLGQFVEALFFFYNSFYAYVKLKGVLWLQENNKRKFLYNSENNKGSHSHKIVVPSYKNYINKRQANILWKYISQRQ